MISTCVLKFDIGIQSLRKYISFLEQLENLSYISPNNLNSPASTFLLQFQVSASTHRGDIRKFEYNSIIVSLYGLLENFIEDLTEEYALRLAQITPNYDDLPTALKEAHISLTAEHIKRTAKDGQFRNTNSRQLVANLNSCLDLNQVDYHINSPVFRYHTANFRHNNIFDFLSCAGIPYSHSALRNNVKFKNYIQNINQGREYSSIPEDSLFHILDDLAERRNHVAHGVESDLLSRNILRDDYLEYVDMFCKTLFDVTLQESLHHEIKNLGIDLGKPLHIYRENIACFILQYGSFSVNDHITSYNADTKCIQHGEIISIHHFFKEKKTISAPYRSSTLICVKISFKPSANAIFSILHNEFQ